MGGGDYGLDPVTIERIAQLSSLALLASLQCNQDFEIVAVGLYVCSPEMPSRTVQVRLFQIRRVAQGNRPRQLSDALVGAVGDQ